MEKGMEKPWKKSELVLLSLSLMVIIAVIAGVTYGYFSVTVLGNSTATSTKIKTGILAVDFVTSEYINNPNMMLIKDSQRAEEAEKSIFVVKPAATATIAAKYDIVLFPVTISENFKSADLKWELLMNNAVIATGNFASFGQKLDLKLNSSPIALALGTEHNYEFRLWLSETSVDQSSLFNGTFEARVMIIATN